MNTDDYLNGSDPLDYGNDVVREYTSLGSATPSVHANATGPIVTGGPVTANAQVTTLRRGLEAVGPILGDFNPAQRCYLGPLAMLAWAFLALSAEGRTADALGVLNVYRALYNSQRAAIVSGFGAAARDALPVSLPEIAWTSAMRLSFMLVLSAVSGRPDQARALSSLPDSVGDIRVWFASHRRLFDEASLRRYLDVPRVGGDIAASSVLSAVQDDVARCLAPPAPAPSVAIGPATGIQCPQGQILVGGRCQAAVAYIPPGYTAPPSQNPPGGGGGYVPPPPPPAASGSGSGLLVGIVALLALGAWWVYRDEERIAKEKQLSVAGAEDA